MKKKQAYSNISSTLQDASKNQNVLRRIPRRAHRSPCSWNCKARVASRSLIDRIDRREGASRVLYLPRNPGSFAVNRLIDTSRVPGRTQGGSLRAIDHWLVARTNNGSRYRSIFPRMTWWIYSPTIAHTGGMHITADPSSHVYMYMYMYTREICFRIEPRHPPLEC